MNESGHASRVCQWAVVLEVFLGAGCLDGRVTTTPLPADGSAATGGGSATGGAGGSGDGSAATGGSTECPSGAAGAGGASGGGPSALISFGCVRLSMAGWDPTVMASADLNGDGKLDFVVGAKRWGARILINDGTGNFAARPQLGSSVLDAVAVSDMNGDRIPDVILTGMGWTDILINDGSGTVAGRATQIDSRDLAVGDLNGDGRGDLVAGGTVFMNVGDGSLSSGIEYSATAGLNELLADMNGDAKLDLVLTNGAESSVGILLNKGDGTFSPRVETPIAGTMVDMEAADLDGDGATDLAFISAQSDNTWRVDVLRNDGTGALTAGSPFMLARFASDIALGDLDGDGHVDAVVLDFGIVDNNVHVLRNIGDGRFTADRTFTSGPIAARLALGDVDGDGKADLVAAIQTYPTFPYREAYEGNIGVYLNETTAP